MAGGIAAVLCTAASVATLTMQPSWTREKLEGKLNEWVDAVPSETGRMTARRRILKAYDLHSESLKLDWLELTTWPDVFGALPWLKEIDLSINKLECFSVKPGDFPGLQRLYLAGNGLTQFSVKRGGLPPAAPARSGSWEYGGFAANAKILLTKHHRQQT